MSKRVINLVSDEDSNRKISRSQSVYRFTTSQREPFYEPPEQARKAVTSNS